MQKPQENHLILENGQIFKGFSFGYSGSAEGEVVFTTGMTGYPESLTDPSYYGQILIFTYPLIGNYGIPDFKKDISSKIIQSGFESGKLQVRGIVISNYSFDYSHSDAVMSLHKWLEENEVPGIYGIDTRELTKVIRSRGVMPGIITTDPNNTKKILTDPNKSNLASLVSVKEPVIYRKNKNKKNKKILLIDCGVKNNIISNFVKRGMEVIRVPWDYDINNSVFDFDGIFISNGPGDPKTCDSTIINLRKAFDLNLPIFGICLGSQILSLSAGADTYKLKFGHRSQNQPCIETKGRCYITSQNHGYAVKSETLPNEWDEWFINNNDGSNEGLKHRNKPYFAVQFHPEASPGPNDTEWLFDMFIDEL